jgi:hypothetical protein
MKDEGSRRRPIFASSNRELTKRNAGIAAINFEGKRPSVGQVFSDHDKTASSVRESTVSRQSLPSTDMLGDDRSIFFEAEYFTFRHRRGLAIW